MEKKRLDTLVVERGLIQSRDRAKAVIMSGAVKVDGRVADKAGEKYPDDAAIEIEGEDIPYVSRGGLKLEKAVNSFGIDLGGLICADIGASTGGFTDCMLQNGAKKVYSIDVGYGQLDWKLRNDSRVVVMERTNARYIEHLDDPVDFASCDVSFISLKHMFPVIKSIGARSAVTLIKPQFEAGRNYVGKNGVVRDKKVHAYVIEKVIEYAAENGFFPFGLDYSPIKGPKGNIEYIAAFSAEASAYTYDIERLVEDSHENLDKDA